MNLRRIIHLTIAVMAATAAAMAQPSASYYKSIDGKKQVALKLALKSVIANHKTLTYSGELPKAYELVYYQDKNHSLVYDLFSYDDYTFSSSSTWNKEHVVPNSWWGGVKNAAYSDIFSVIPSEKTANNRKSNFPIGTVGSQTWTNGCIKVGRPVSGQGGTYNNVFEPADEYKGDFARIYFYVATCYSDIAWGSNSNVVSEITKEDWPTLNPWLYKLLLEWHNQDPVSAKEIQINNSAEAVQGNRNPFIDYPVLADYIWGTYGTETFDLTTAELYKHISGEGPGEGGGNDDGDKDKDDEKTDTIKAGTVLLEEYFDGLTAGNNTTSSGSGTYWSGNENFPMVSATYEAGGAVKLATGSKEGSITSRTIIYDGGPLVVDIGVKGWTSVEGPLIVSVGSDTRTITYKARMSDKFETIHLEYEAVSSNPILSIKSASKQRCFIDYVVVSAGQKAEPLVPGDVNGDGLVDTQDVLAVYSYMQSPDSDADINLFDINGDGTVDTQDVLLVYEYMEKQE